MNKHAQLGQVRRQLENYNSFSTVFQIARGIPAKSKKKTKKRRSARNYRIIQYLISNASCEHVRARDSGGFYLQDLSMVDSLFQSRIAGLINLIPADTVIFLDERLLEITVYPSSRVVHSLSISKQLISSKRNQRRERKREGAGGEGERERK